MIEAQWLGLDWAWTAGSIQNLVAALSLGAFSLIVAKMAQFEGRAFWYGLHGASIMVSQTFEFLVGGLKLPLGTDFVPDAALLASAPAATWWLITGFTAVVALAGIAWIISLAGLIRSHGASRAWKFAIAGMFGIWALAIPGTLEAWSANLGYASLNFHLITQNVFYPALHGILLLAPIALAAAWIRDRDPGQAVVAVALSAYMILVRVSIGVEAALARSPYALIGLLGVVAALAYSIAWFRASHKTGDTLPLRTALAFPGFFAVAVLLGLYFGREAVASSAIAWTLEIILIGYSVLRWQTFGLDVKLRWGISKSTVAAIFVAVIFIASEGAQLVFGEGNEWLGLAAGGMLVFALAPLNRFADRVAETAIPVAGEGPSTNTETYRLLLRKFLADATLNPDEEMALARAATALGLTPEQTVALKAQESG